MVAVLVAGAAYAAADAVRGSDVDCSATEAPTLTAALLLAQACGHDVVALDSLDPYSSLTATPVGAVRASASTGAVRTDVSGEWAPVDPRVVTDEESGELRVASPVHAITFDPKDGSGFVAIESDEGAISLDVPVDLGAPRVSGTQVVWDVLDAAGSVIDGVELIAQVQPDASGVTPLFEVRDAAAYEDLEQASGGRIAFEYVTSGSLELRDERGKAFSAVDGQTGDTVFAAAEARQWDSASGVPSGGEREGTKAGAVDSGVAPADGDSVSTLEVEVRDDAATVVADGDMAGDPDTVWPVTIDPKIEDHKLNQWIVVRDFAGWPSKYNTDGNEGVGYCPSVSVTAGCQGVHRSRVFWQFNNMGVLKELSAQDVISAQFRAKGVHSWDCSGPALDLYLTGGFTSSTTWATQPATKMKLSSARPKHRDACGGATFDEWDATAAAKDYAGVNTSMTLGLRAASETEPSWWRYELHTAQLDVLFNRAPTIDTASRTTFWTARKATKENACSATPVLVNSTDVQVSVLARDPDGSQVRVHLQVYKSGSRLWDYSFQLKSSGTAFVKTIPSELLGDGTFSWRVRAEDPDGLLSEWTSSCFFEIDTVKPGPIQIRAMEGDERKEIRAVYAQRLERGGVGQTGCFELSSSASDAHQFWYSFGTTARDEHILASNGKAVVCFTPEAAGSAFISALIKDRAGNESENTKYGFFVAHPREDGVWSFDEGTSPAKDDSLAWERDPKLGVGPITVAGAKWAQGPHAEFLSREGDLALDFDGQDDEAYTASPVFATDDSFVIAAHVRPDAVATPRTVIVQEGATNGVWSVGLVNSGCPGTLTTCWGFSTLDKFGATWTVRSSVAPAKYAWTQLTAEYDASKGRIRLWVCDIGTLNRPAPGEPIESKVSTPNPLRSASGPVVLGRGQSGGAAAGWWDGRIDNVRMFKGQVVADAKIRRMCQGAEANQVQGGEAALDPTTTVGQ
ncbi:LamG-like jellyroll fold domain-containing protein [Cellulomonas sp. CW35]|uniref:LamG-like jellyroll fold domain-containing protein n=1 Tax=Cellulomonas sp. CW35 TaxID=3458249 RepID=UPI0040341DF8